MSYDNLNTVTFSRNPVAKIRVKNVTVYNFFGEHCETPPRVCCQYRVTKSGRQSTAPPKVFVHVRDMFQHLSVDWHNLPKGFDYICVDTILSVDDSVIKLAKTKKRFANVLSIIFYGAAANQAGVGNQCKHATKECMRLCLISSGKGGTAQVALVRIARTRLSVLNPELFWDMWDRDFAKFARKAERENKVLACRPNGTTDVMPKQLQSRIWANPSVTFYDYTAVPSRTAFERVTPNYHITLSRKETKANHLWIKSQPWRYNVAVVVTPDLQSRLLATDPEGDLYINMDEHDLRIPEVDGIGKIGLLAPKGKARGKESGFIATTIEQVTDLVR